MKVLVVGLNPSRKHGSSPSLKTLYKWFDYLGIRYASFMNMYEDYEIDYKDKKLQYIKEISKDYERIIALGNQVSDDLCSVDIDHYKLPHPSPLNRQLNDPEFVSEHLKSCKIYLLGGTDAVFRRFQDR